MFDLIYNFINELIFGTASTMSESIKETACTLLTILILTMFVVVLIRLVVWAFYVVKKPFKSR